MTIGSETRSRSVCAARLPAAGPRRALPRPALPCLALACLALGLARPGPAAERPEPERGERQTASAPPREEIAGAVERLGSASFRDREAAMQRLLEIGPPALPQLDEARQAEDPEVQLRVRMLARRIRTLDFEDKAERFLAEEDGGDPLPGWDYAERLIGDRPRAREWYVELLRAHPRLGEALDASPEARGRAAATIIAAPGVPDNVPAGLPVGMRMQEPDAMDVAAVLLAVNDWDEAIPESAHRGLRSWFYRAVAREALHAPAFGPLVQQLASDWIASAPTDMAADLLNLAMQHRLTGGRSLARRILDQEPDLEPTAAAAALLAVGRFGDLTDIPRLRARFDDDRPVPDEEAPQPNAAGDDPRAGLPVQVRDVALAVALHQVGLDPGDAGFPAARRSVTTPFDPESLGLPDDEARARARERFEERLAAVRQEAGDGGADAAGPEDG